MSAHYDRGHALFELKRYQEAAAAFQQALADEPNSALTHAMLASTLVNLQRTDEADSAVRRAIELDPEFGYSFYILSIVELQRNHVAHAERAIAESLRLDPSPDAYYQAAVLAEFTNRVDDALTYTDQVLRLDPQHKPTVLLRGKLLIRAGRLDEAQALYAAALAHNPEHAATQLALGALRLRTGDAPAALGMLREARRLDPITANDVLSISMAYGRMLGPIRDANRRLLRWHLWSPERQCALFAVLAVVLTIGSSFASAQQYAGAFSELWALGCMILATYLVLPFSLDCAAAGAGQFALRRELGRSGAEALGCLLFLFPILLMQAAALYLGILLVIPAIAMLLCLYTACFPLLYRNLRTFVGRILSVSMLVGFYGKILHGELSRYLAGMGLDRLWISALIVSGTVAVIVITDVATAAVDSWNARRPLAAPAP